MLHEKMTSIIKLQRTCILSTICKKKGDTHNLLEMIILEDFNGSLYIINNAGRYFDYGNYLQTRFLLSNYTNLLKHFWKRQ